MKNLFFILFLIFPFTLFSQESVINNLPLIFSLNSDELRTLVTAKTSQIKMSDEEIIKISKIIEGRKEEYFKLVEQVKKSLPRNSNGKIIGKADPQKMQEREAVINEVSTSIFDFLGEKRFRQFHRTLVYEVMRRNEEGFKNALKNKKK